MDAFTFITEGDHQELMAVLGKAKCRSCDGTGEISDREADEAMWNIWACKRCDGKGWDRQSVREIITAVDINESEKEQ